MAKQGVDHNDPIHKSPLVKKIAEIVAKKGLQAAEIREAIIDFFKVKRCKVKEVEFKSNEDLIINVENGYRAIKITRAEVERMIEMHELRKEVVPDPSLELIKRIIDNNTEVQILLLKIEGHYGWKLTQWFCELAHQYELRGDKLIKEFEKYAEKSGYKDEYGYLDFAYDVFEEFKTT